MKGSEGEVMMKKAEGDEVVSDKVGNISDERA